MLLVPLVLVFATLPLTSAMTYVFDKPRIPALVNMAQLLLLLAFIVTVGGSTDINGLVCVYSVIRSGGTVLVAALAWFYLNRWS